MSNGPLLIAIRDTDSGGRWSARLVSRPPGGERTLGRHMSFGTIETRHIPSLDGIVRYRDGGIESTHTPGQEDRGYVRVLVPLARSRLYIVNAFFATVCVNGQSMARPQNGQSAEHRPYSSSPTPVSPPARPCMRRLSRSSVLLSLTMLRPPGLSRPLRRRGGLESSPSPSSSSSS